MSIRIRRGLDLPIAGVPEQVIDRAVNVKRVALLGADYVGMKPTMLVKQGDTVKLGQPVFSDKKTAGVQYTSPASGVVAEVNRGAKRVFESIVIEVSGNDEVTFQSHGNADLSKLSRESVQKNLVDSGLWTAFRRRPYSKVPRLTEQPHAIFVQAIDTNPLAPLPSVIIAEGPGDFRYGLQVIKRLTEGVVHVCTAPGVSVPGGDAKDVPVEGVKVTAFDGPHPAGLPGTHIHFLSPASDSRPVWHINYQDVIAIGKLFTTGKLSVERVISLAGPQVNEPRLLRTRIGACVTDLISNELKEGENRVISGSVLRGHVAEGRFAYLGRFHNQVSVLKEGRERELLGWQMPGFNKFSVKPAYASSLSSDGNLFDLTTNLNGSHRAIVPIGMYEKVMPLDIEPTFLLRALATNDSEQAQLLGASELDEEDLALLTFVDIGKHDFAPMLRKVLTTIEKEG